MALLSQTPKKVTGGILAIVLCVFSLGLITLWSYEGGVSPEASGIIHSTRNAVSTIIAPFNRASSVVGQATDAVGTATDNFTANPESLRELQLLNEELAALVIRLEESRLENERLTELLGLVQAYDLEATAARILSTSIDSWNQTITIDKGTEDGLAVGMPVMSPNGLIGQIESVGRYTADVRLLTDPNSGVAVIIQGSRNEGVLSGSHTRLLYLSYISLDVPVAPGDAIVTSGAGGVYPKGIIIGEVTSVHYLPSDVFQTIVVKPTARVKYYEEVLVLTGRPSEVTYNALIAMYGEDYPGTNGANNANGANGNGTNGNGTNGNGSAAPANGGGGH